MAAHGGRHLFIKTSPAFAAILLLASCAVAPAVNYRLLSERPQGDDWAPYQLTDTTILVGVVGGAPALRADPQIVGLTPVEVSCSASGCDKATVGAVAAPIPFQGETFGIEPRRSRFVRTILTPTYYPNSLRLKTLAIEGHDQRKEIIDTVGALAVGAAQLARGGGERSGSLPGYRTLNLPVVIDLAAAKETASQGPRPLPGNPGWSYVGRFLDDPAASGFRRRAEAKTVHGAIVTSLCRPYQLTLTAGGANLVMGLTVADPDFLVSIPFPAKGVVNFGVLCGADIQAQPVTETTADVLVTDFFKQVQNLRTAASGKGK